MNDAMVSLLTALLCYIAVVFLIDQHVLKPKPYKIAWALGLFFFGTGGLAQFFGTAGHWTPLDYRLWYLDGAILAAPFLGLGSLYLLAPRKWVDRITAALAIFSVYAVIRVLTVPLTPRTGWLPTGETVTTWLASAPNDAVVNAGAHPIMPSDIVLVIIFFNSLGAFALVGGAAWSAWKFLKTRQNPTRLASMILLMIGGLAPTLAGTLTKFGVSGAFFLLTFVGALFLLAGYLVSIDVFAVLRVPFTDHVLLDRRLTPALAGVPPLSTRAQPAPRVAVSFASKPRADAVATVKTSSASATATATRAGNAKPVRATSSVTSTASVKTPITSGKTSTSPRKSAQTRPVVTNRPIQMTRKSQ